MQLTDRAIRALKPANKPYKKTDSNGLYLEIMPGGAKVWRFKFRLNGKESRVTLGRWPDMGAHEAREKSIESRRVLSTGKNPARLKQMEKMTAIVTAASTVRAVGCDWFEKHKKSVVPRHAVDTRRMLDKWVFPFVGDVPVSELTAPMVLVYIRELEKKTVPFNVEQALQKLNQIMKHATLCGMVNFNPVSDLSGLLPARKQNKRPAMPLHMIPEFFTRLENSDASWQTKAALNILPYIFVRPGELCGALWDEFDFKAALWRIPAERMKMKNEHIVPLSKQVIHLLQSLPGYNRNKKTWFSPDRNNKKYLFPSAAKQGFLSVCTLSTYMNKLGYKGIACPHGFRATASTTLNENGFSADAIERQLAHSEQNKVRAAYNRTEYLDERREMMQWWSDFIDGKAEPANVVKLRRRA
ncbi:tyrosine-type recombinase/integrase [Salmonella enterica]|nr:tyrosine-type recombinase/integrase [Salmonella enterica]